MRIFVRKLLAPLLGAEQRKRLKSLEYQTKRWINSRTPAIDAKRFRQLLTDLLRIRQGDHVFVHASLGQLNTPVSPAELIEILLEIVGPNGSVGAPTFAAQASEVWMRSPEMFDVQKTPSGMGKFSEVLRRHPDALRSLHPTKSVAIIGAEAAEIVGSHHESIYAFGPKSPFAKLVDRNAKVIGVGAPMSYLSMAHVVEDVNPSEFPVQVNYPEPLVKACRTASGDVVEVSTLVHRMDVVAKANPERFCRAFVSRDHAVIAQRWFAQFFMVEGREYFKAQERAMRQGRTMYD